ncbi:MAG: VTT domain-containing protein [Halobacteria archaeon]
MTRERLRALLLVAAALAALAFFYWLSSTLGLLRPESGLRESIAGAGAAGPLLLTGAMVLAAVVVVIPNGLVGALGGALFGFPVGFGCAVAGQTAGSLLCYGIARGAGRAPLRWAFGDAARQVESFWGRHGFWGTLLLRLVPLASFDAVSYAAGAAGVPLRPFAAASLLGMLPMTALFVALGDVLLGPEGTVLLATGGAVALMFLLPLLRKPAA